MGGGSKIIKKCIAVFLTLEHSRRVCQTQIFLKNIDFLKNIFEQYTKGFNFLS